MPVINRSKYSRLILMRPGFWFVAPVAATSLTIRVIPRTRAMHLRKFVIERDIPSVRRGRHGQQFRKQK